VGVSALWSNAHVAPRVLLLCFCTRFGAGIAREDAQVLVDASDVCRFNAGDALIREGSVGTCLYFLSDGEVVVYLTEGKSVRSLGHCLPPSPPLPSPPSPTLATTHNQPLPIAWLLIMGVRGVALSTALGAVTLALCRGGS
jgi:hypothetical protein